MELSDDGFVPTGTSGTATPGAPDKHTIKVYGDMTAEEQLAVKQKLVGHLMGQIREQLGNPTAYAPMEVKLIRESLLAMSEAFAILVRGAQQ